MSHPCHKDKIANIRRIKGQLEGIERMINDEKYCIDILNQMKAIKNALTSVEARILETHLKECVKDSLDTSHDNQAKIDEIINILKRNGISTKTLNIKKTDVRNYDAAFFCNSIRKIWNIRSIGNIRYQSSDLVDQIKILIDENV